MRIISYIIFIAIIFQDINAQENFCTAFWNVENLFDTIDAP